MNNMSPTFFEIFVGLMIIVVFVAGAHGIYMAHKDTISRCNYAYHQCTQTDILQRNDCYKKLVDRSLFECNSE